jgi:cytidylate kinase
MPGSIDLIIDRQFRRWDYELRKSRGSVEAADPPPAHRPVITISRQHGTHGTRVAAELANRFEYTLLHRDVIDRMCASTGISRRLMEALDEHSRSELTNWFDSMLAGKYVSAGDYVAALLKTVYSIAQLGGVVVVGRGANFIVGPERGFHARVVAPREDRIRALTMRKEISVKEAAREVDERDHERASFARRLFGRSVDDPLAYDVTINQEGLSPEALARILASAAREKLERLRVRIAQAA